jgi:hypothetical protein
MIGGVSLGHSRDGKQHCSHNRNIRKSLAMKVSKSFFNRRFTSCYRGFTAVNIFKVTA